MRTPGSGWGAGPTLWQKCPKCGKKKCFYSPIPNAEYYMPFKCTACEQRSTFNDDPNLLRQKHASNDKK